MLGHNTNKHPVRHDVLVSVAQEDNLLALSLLALVRRGHVIRRVEPPQGKGAVGDRRVFITVLHHVIQPFFGLLRTVFVRLNAVRQHLRSQRFKVIGRRPQGNPLAATGIAQNHLLAFFYCQPLQNLLRGPIRRAKIPHLGHVRQTRYG